MENILCKTLSAENQNKPKSLSVDNEGSYSSETIIFSKEILPLSEENLKINVAEETNQGMNDYNVSKTPSDCDSPKVPDSIMQKTISPTLIGSAIKVMKNFFSPDKTKSKSASVLSSINHPKSASGSPRSSIFIPGKTELSSLEPETEIHNKFQSAPEGNLKNPLPINELGVIQSPLTLDPFNNTDDSFLTTVSLIDESFHSAVTHLDEHGDTLKNINLMENILNSSRNLDMIDSYNDSFENNETCLENTTLKNNSFTSEGTKLTNSSVQSLENLSSTQFGDGNCFMDDSEKFCQTKIQDETFKENVNDSILREKDFISGSLEVLMPSHLLIKNAEETGFQENLTSTSLPTTINSEVNNMGENVEMAHLFLSKSFQIPSPTQSNEVYENCFNPNMIDEGKEQNNEFINKLKAKENDTDLEASSEEQDGIMENCISTTTVVLSTVDSADLNHMLMSLKADDSGTNTSSLTSFEGDDGPCFLENVTENSLLKKVDRALQKKQTSESCSSSAKNFFPFTEDKRSCMSEGNSPNNKAECTKIKLNKSDELISRRVSLESPDIRRALKEKKSSVDISLMKNSEASEISKQLPVHDNIKEILDFRKHNMSETDKSKMGLHSDNPDPVPIVSQQSYTILSSHDKSLNRPIIEPLNICGDLEKQTFQTDQSDTMYSSEEKKVEEWFMNNFNSSFSAEDLVKSRQPKQSTPLLEEQNETPQNMFMPSSLTLYSPELIESSCDDKEIDLLGKTTQTLFTEEASAVLSYVNFNNESEFPLSVSVGNETGESLHDLINTKILSTENSGEQIRNPGQKLEMIKSERSQNDLGETLPVIHNANQTFDIRPLSIDTTYKLNQTLEKNSNSPDCNSGNYSLKLLESKLNLTYGTNLDSEKTFIKKVKSEIDLTDKIFVTPSEDNQLNQTLSKAESFEFSKLNERLSKTSELSLPSSTTPVADRILKSPASDKTNETLVKETEFSDICMNKKSKEMNAAFESNEISESIACGVKSESEQEIDIKVPEGNKTFQKSETTDLESLPCRININVELDSRDNESFVSTKSSDTSLACSDLSTVLNNEGRLTGNESVDDLTGKLGKLNLNENLNQAAEEQFDGRNIMLPENVPSFTDLLEEQNLQTEEKLPSSVKNEKLPCDPDIMQLIQEQFSSKDIERICSVVHDFSSIKLSSDILRASEEFDKSFHGNLTSTGLKQPENEMTFNQPVSTLSPQSLDFLNSIRGKPTGRDLSRESLYVKFDPLVQSSANSLIDFTKEGEAIATADTSPVNHHSSSICEQLLTISPQKKPDDIVPPLTPLSHKTKADVNDEKIERLKKLQNEIYFLKNLYAERERANRTKMENYESQIAKLTGESCMLEDKLKGFNEREKSLVKKMKEQTQNIGQLKTIMEEYVKVISKLSVELKTIKNEKLKQIETLSLEKDSYMTHLQNTEAAFTDVHAKYEKSKKTIVSLKANETMYRNTIAEQTQKLEDFKLKAKEAQENALLGFQKIQEELNETKASHTQETARLRAQLRKTELKVEALQEALDQKVKENQQLTAICDELIEGKK